MYNELINKEKKLAVIGLGYVGLPIALEFAKKISVIGFDINADRIQLMREGIDPSKELDKEAFNNCDIEFTNSLDKLREANFFIVAVPTPVDKHNVPDLTPVQKASETIGKVVKKGDYVVFESTVYPGCTEEDCLPLIESLSGLKNVIDFKLGYSPERINPGDKEHTLASIVKVVSGCDDESLDTIAKVYELVVTAGVHKASCIKVAEAAKIIENTQRDLNIALMNELSIIFDKMNINTFEVLEAAGTKWNFLKFQPGLVGGHCIGVDPYYLAQKAQELGYHPEIILAGRRLNDDMGSYVAREVIKLMINKDIQVRNSNILILGFTFKENCPDVRNTKVIDIIDELKTYNTDLTVYDPWARPNEVFHEYGFETLAEIDAVNQKQYNAIILAVGHKEFKDLDLAAIKAKDCIVYDVKGFLDTKEIDARL